MEGYITSHDITVEAPENENIKAYTTRVKAGHSSEVRKIEIMTSLHETNNTSLTAVMVTT